MSPLRPYLLRAMLEWVNDNSLTPHVLVDATVEGVSVPEAAVSDGRIVLNVSPEAVPDLEVSDVGMSFTARFSGRTFPVFLPADSIAAVFCKEAGLGMALPPELATPPSDPTPPPSPPQSKEARRSHLRVVK